MKLSTGIALAATLIAPSMVQANNDLFNWYGSIRVELQSSRNGEVEYKDNYSRVGAYGSTEISEGLKVNYNYEIR